MTDQLDLLDYPNWPGFRARDTSKAAADAVAPKAANLRERALFEIRLRREDGLTADEVAKTLGHDVLTIRPRVAELARLGLIRDSKKRRQNRSGKSAIVWVRND